MNTKFETRIPSENPEEVLDSISYKGIPNQNRVYRHGFESYIASLPIMKQGEELLDEKVFIADMVMARLSREIENYPWVKHNMPSRNTMDRFILAVEKPEIDCSGGTTACMITKQGSQIVIARFATGFETAPHGHAGGYFYEEVFSGKGLITDYRLMDNGKVRPVSTYIAEKGRRESAFSDASGRTTHIHKVKSLEDFITLNVIGEQAPDGRGNTYEVERFETVYNMNDDDVCRVQIKDAMYSRRGTVLLVRSSNVPDMGDHFFIVTGQNVMKEHGLRPQGVAIESIASSILDDYQEIDGFVLLKLSDEASNAFLEFHGIEVVGNEIKTSYELVNS
jgi:hypothetical protein